MYKRPHLTKVGTLFLFCHCGPALGSQIALRSGIDARFRWKSSSVPAPASVSSPGVGFYQIVLGQTLSSHCGYFPSDSAFAQNLHRRCGALKGIVKSYARFSREVDAHVLGFPLVPMRDGKLYFHETEDNCDWNF